MNPGLLNLDRSCEYFALECLESLLLKGVCFRGAFLDISNVEVACSFQILLSLLSPNDERTLNSC